MAGAAEATRRANRNNFSNRFPQIVAALTVLSVRSCLIDDEAVVCNERVAIIASLAMRVMRHSSIAVAVVIRSG